MMGQRLHKSILITPLEKPENVQVKRYLGLVRSVVTDVIPPHLEIKTLFTSARKRRSPISIFLTSLIHDALLDIEEKTKEVGGNAVLGLRVEVVNLGWGRVSVIVYGTAAEVE